MATVVRKIFPVITIFWVCLGFARISFAQQDNSAPLSTIDVFIQTLLSEETPLELRELHARALLSDPNAHPVLIDKVLSSEGNLAAKVIVCRMIAKGNWGRSGLGFSKSAQVPHIFSEPLFGMLFESDPELIRWAGPALIRCRNDVTKKLSEIIADPQRPAAQRIAGVSALKLIPGKGSVLTLADLLSEQNDEIRQKANTALAEMLYFSGPLDVKEFTTIYLPEIRQTDEVTFLRWLNDRQQLRLTQANSQVVAIRQQADLLKGRIIKVEEGKFVLAKSSEEKLKLLIENLKKDQEEFLREWAMDQVVLWSNTTALRDSELSSQVIELIKGYITDGNPQVRKSTALALGNLNPEAVRAASAELLLEQLGKETAMPAKAAQLVTLGKIGYVKAMGPALKLWEKSPDVLVAASAVGVLGRVVSIDDSVEMERVVSSLAGNFSRWKDSTEVRVALIKAIKKMAEMPKSRQLLWKNFTDFLPESLGDKNATVRSQAVEAFVQLRESQALPIFLSSANNMLNDPDSSVRFAVINAIKAFGDKEHLELLRQRRLEELKTENFDVAGLLEGVMESILESLSIQAVYDWSVGLADAAENEKVLYQQASGILWKKIAQADTDGLEVALAHRILALDGQANTSRDKMLYGDAIKWYRMLLDLKLPDARQIAYRQAILDIILANNSVDLITAAKPAITPLLSSSSKALSQLASLSDSFELKDEQQLNSSINVIMTLIVPLKSYPSDQQKKAWQKRRAELALAILQPQVKLLADNGKVKKEAIDTMAALVPELTAYPHDGTAEQKKTALESYKTLLLGSLVQDTKPPKNSKPEK